MAQLGYVDPNAEERTSNFDPLPDGWYPAQLIEADVVPTKAGDGTRMPYTVEIIEGDLAKRRVWGGINLQSRSAEAQRIGQSELRQLSEALGFAWPLPADINSDAFLFKPMEIRVGRQKDNRERNEVKAFRPYGGGQPASQAQGGQPQSHQQPQQQPQQQAAPASRAAAGGSRPWAR